MSDKIEVGTPLSDAKRRAALLRQLNAEMDETEPVSPMKAAIAFATAAYPDEFTCNEMSAILGWGRGMASSYCNRLTSRGVMERTALGGGRGHVSRFRYNPDYVPAPRAERQAINAGDERRHLVCTWCRGLFLARDVPRPRRAKIVIGPRRRCPRCGEWGTVRNGMFIVASGSMARVLTFCIAAGCHLRLTDENNIKPSQTPPPEIVADIQRNKAALVRLLMATGYMFGQVNDGTAAR